MMFFFWSFWHFWDVSIEICRYKSTFPKNRLQVHWTRLAKKRRFFLFVFFSFWPKRNSLREKTASIFFALCFFFKSRKQNVVVVTVVVDDVDAGLAHQLQQSSFREQRRPGTAWNSLEQSGTVWNSKGWRGRRWGRRRKLSLFFTFFWCAKGEALETPKKKIISMSKLSMEPTKSQSKRFTAPLSRFRAVFFSSSKRRKMKTLIGSLTQLNRVT